MFSMMTTKSGTAFIGGVEYSDYPPPAGLVKVMERRWAQKLLASGSMQFGNLVSYRRWENEVLGDPNDGHAMYMMNGHPYQLGSANPIYAWCAARLEISADRLLLLAEHGKYDCVVRVHEPLALIQRVRAALTGDNSIFHLQCSQVSYNRGAVVSKDTFIRIQNKFQSNVSEKDPRFSPDKEYRLWLTDSSRRPARKAHVDVEIGECSDILSIEELPNKSADVSA